MAEPEEPLLGRLRTLVVGRARDLRDRSIYHRLTLAAFLAWVGLGSDGLSSSCYGPPEAFVTLHGHPHLGIFVALATAVTVLVISTSYSQIVELFPAGGGGYLVASKLLSPRAGAVSGCALLVDYVLTIAISVVSGVEALLSFLPSHWHSWRLALTVSVVLLLTLLNIRGVKESVAPLVPIFLVFVLTHWFIILYALLTHLPDMGQLASQTASEVGRTRSELGLWGMLFLIMHSYSMGAGTYTGIEAVSNGIPILREPKVHTAKKTMTCMAVSLAFTAAGLMLTYILYKVGPVAGKTLNAVMLERAAANWAPTWGGTFVIVALVSEAAILCIAAQTGFLDAPRVLANMAMDRWMPARLSMLSDRLVTRNGVLLMSTAAIVTILLTRGSVGVLVVLYSINVFITFALSQTGMVRHWWGCRKTVRNWRRGLVVNGLGLGLTGLILVWVVVAKFYEGGWVTLLVTGALVALAMMIRRHYDSVARNVSGFNRLAESVLEIARSRPKRTAEAVPCDPSAKTAVVLVNGFNGLGMHSVQNVIRYFGDCFRNFVFVGVGMVDAGNFKGAAETHRLQEHVETETGRYVELMRNEGYYAESACSIGTDIAEEVDKAASQIVKRFPQSVFFAGQLIFARESVFTRLLHNNIVFAVQRRLYRRGLPFVIMPFRA